MGAFMLLLRGVGLAIGGALVWLLFVTVPPWLCGFSLCRSNAWWTGDDKIKGYVTIKNVRLAHLLIPEYIGWNSVLHANIPLLCNRYTMNKYPERLGVLGLLNYIVTIPTCIAYWVCVTDFLFTHFLDGNWALWAFFALVIESVVFFALSNWNTGDRREPTILITRQGMRQIRAARRAKRKRRVKRGK